MHYNQDLIGFDLFCWKKPTKMALVNALKNARLLSNFFTPIILFFQDRNSNNLLC